jgi:hypothetical protein
MSSLTSCQFPFSSFHIPRSDSLFSLRAFSLPGSMYFSILGGKVWGAPRALPLACACVATGATLCYFLYSPAVLTIPAFQARLELWSAKISAQRANLIPFLIVLRIAPLHPHWAVNVLASRLGIGLIPFWFSTFLGNFGHSHTHLNRLWSRRDDFCRRFSPYLMAQLPHPCERFARQWRQG